MYHAAWFEMGRSFAACALVGLGGVGSGVAGAVAGLGPEGGIAGDGARVLPAVDERDGALDDEEQDLSAAELIEHGLAHLQAGLSAKAARTFRSAVRTGDLTSEGRTFAYWYMSLAALRTGALDESANALADFLVVGQDVIDARGEASVAAPAPDDFARLFDLARRLDRARAILSAMWAAKAQGYGRSALRPVVVRTDEEVTYFLELAPPCAGAADRRVTRRQAESGGDTRTGRVAVSCGQNPEPVEFFFAPMSR